MNEHFYQMSQDQFCTDISLPDNLQNRGVEWKSILDIDKDAKFLSPDTNHYNRRFEIKQGEYGGGYFLAAVAGLTGYPELFKMVVEEKSLEEVYNRNRLKGKFSFNFYHKGMMHCVLVDDRLPTIEGRLLFSQAVNGVYWCPLVEKAYAKFIGGYRNLSTGQIKEALNHLTNQPTSYLTTVSMSNDAIFFKLDDLIKKKSMICCKSKHQNGNNEKYGRSFTITGVNQNNGDYMIRVKSPVDKEEFWVGTNDFRERYDYIYYTMESDNRRNRPTREGLFDSRGRNNHSSGLIGRSDDDVEGPSCGIM